ncbi:MAG: bifunctional glutamate N-acetyltransferase/amino-acid acetyltransferase ArgJ [Bifidobacteriaceae bacterium]|jgi:glutamate N-acetyltransferase/amino-acid N-acetyltransferase|nr:bifunctional glutamate N-acetyltransferase/amino-acid acetyltransferase ArgJ [Bifidobacteriaceae bacterium]
MSVTSPKGFRAAGTAAGLKTNGAKDLALVVNDGPADLAVAAGVFTANRFAAAPVHLSRRHLALAQSGLAVPRAVVLNSGGANACTGQQGVSDAALTAQRVAELLQIAPHDVLVCSTGLIGDSLAMDKLLPGLEEVAATAQATPKVGQDAAEAIMTTDTVPKQAQLEAPDGAYSIGGMAKGAGMLAPELATMLVVITTDAVLDQATARQALEQACAQSFNRIDSDGCMSTNDSVILLVSGASGHRPEPSQFAQLLTAVAQDLARQLIADAEGASHEIAVTVKGALTEDGALAVARGIVRSNLFKTAMAGNDPNWGRILSAAGTVPAAVAPFDPAKVDVTIGGAMVCQGGGPGVAREQADLTGRVVEVLVDLHAGTCQATIWTNDLTHEYVSINADYSS